MNRRGLVSAMGAGVLAGCAGSPSQENNISYMDEDNIVADYKRLLNFLPTPKYLNVSHMLATFHSPITATELESNEDLYRIFDWRHKGNPMGRLYEYKTIDAALSMWTGTVVPTPDLNQGKNSLVENDFQMTTYYKNFEVWNGSLDLGGTRGSTRISVAINQDYTITAIHQTEFPEDLLNRLIDNGTNSDMQFSTTTEKFLDRLGGHYFRLMIVTEDSKLSEYAKKIILSNTNNQSHLITYRINYFGKIRCDHMRGQTDELEL
jgi:hypothetical protein